ncbi:MAG: reactive intermediate/imine deaminase, partial [Gammaproteobacteria bacterium RIFCSPLOWO2_02_FULL_52_10]
MSREIIKTPRAPQAIGTYSQAVRINNTVYISGQIPLQPETMELVTGGMEQQIRRVFDNLKVIAEAAGGTLAEIVKLTIYLIDLEDFPLLNRIMAEH